MVSLSLSFSLQKSESQPHDDGCTTPGNHNRLVESLFDTAFTVELYITTVMRRAYLRTCTDANFIDHVRGTRRKRATSV